MNHPSQTGVPQAGGVFPRGRSLIAGAIAVAALGVVIALAASRQAPPAAEPAKVSAAAPVSTPRPRVQLALHHAERFQVDQPFRHLWRADQPVVTSGWLLVVSGDPQLLMPRQAKDPVLYVGAQTAERINTGRDSGRVVLLVPGDFALGDAPIFLGDEALPEELRQPQIEAQLAAAVAAGAIATPAATVAKVTVPGSTTYATDFELRLRAIDLVEQHSPTEKDLIAGWRVPRGSLSAGAAEVR